MQRTFTRFVPPGAGIFVNSENTQSTCRVFQLYSSSGCDISIGTLHLRSKWSQRKGFSRSVKTSKPMRRVLVSKIYQHVKIRISPQAHPCTRMPGFNVSSAARESHILFLVQSSSKEAYCIVHLVGESSEVWQRRGLWSAEAMVFSVTIYRPRSFISTNIPYPRFANLQSRRRSRLARNLHLPLRRTHLVLRHFLLQTPAMVNLRAMGKGRHSQAGYLQVLTQRCRRGCAFDGDTSRGRLQGRAYREGIDMGRFVTCV